MKCGCDEVMVGEVTTHLESRDGCSGTCDNMMGSYCFMLPDWTWFIASPPEAIRVGRTTPSEV